MSMEVSPVELLIFQPTPFCNLNCTYCYLPDRKDKRVMDVGIVRTTVEKLKEEQLLAPGLGIIWHAGEPTVVRREQYAGLFRTDSRQCSGTSSWCNTSKLTAR